MKVALGTSNANSTIPLGDCHSQSIRVLPANYHVTHQDVGATQSSFTTPEPAFILCSFSMFALFLRLARDPWDTEGPQKQ